jgi:hypothetical protein
VFPLPAPQQQGGQPLPVDEMYMRQYVERIRIICHTEQAAANHNNDSTTTTTTTTTTITTSTTTGEEEVRVPWWKADLSLHVYQLNTDGEDEGFSTADPNDEDEEGGGQTASSRMWTLPAVELEDLWDTLYYNQGIKNNLLNYAKSALLFSDAKVNQHLISCNRIVLLHGPPGTGKTSLCRAIAQKLSIRMGNRFSNGTQLLEINSHSLFSKWFSESGKLIGRLFDQIYELVEDQDSLICILIDEVESLTSARQAAVSGSEPTDAIRAVNALLVRITARCLCVFFLFQVASSHAYHDCCCCCCPHYLLSYLPYNILYRRNWTV